MTDGVLDKSTGFDDTQKAAGVCVHDKTDHIPIISDEGRKTELMPNLSHLAKHQTTTPKHKLHTSAVLGGGDTTEQGIIDHITFCLTMLLITM